MYSERGRRSEVADGEAKELTVDVSELGCGCLQHDGVRVGADVEHVVEERVGLLDQYGARRRHADAPEDERAGPKGATVAQLEGEAVHITDEMLEAWREHVDSLPKMQVDDVSHVAEVVQPVMLSWTPVGGDGNGTQSTSREEDGT